MFRSSSARSSPVNPESGRRRARLLLDLERTRSPPYIIIIIIKADLSPTLATKEPEHDTMTDSLPRTATTAPRVPADASEHPPVPRLTRIQFWSCFAIAVTIFVFVTGPVWNHPWDISVLNDAILLSYIPIPLLVLGCLAWRRALNFRGFFLDTLELTLLKYSVTFTFAMALWAVQEQPPPASAPTSQARAQLAAPEPPPPAPTPIDPAKTGVLQGVVKDASARPAAGVLVFVESGLEGYVFAPPTEPVRIENNGAGISPRLSVAELRQPIEARSTDGHLHTFIAVSEKGGATLFNTPLLSSGAWTHVSIREAGVIAKLHCSVHQRSANETPAHLAILAHPFHAITGADGRFRLSGVPAGALRVAAFDPDRGESTQGVRLDAGGSVEIDIALGSPKAE